MSLLALISLTGVAVGLKTQWQQCREVTHCTLPSPQGTQTAHLVGTLEYVRHVWLAGVGLPSLPSAGHSLKGGTKNLRQHS